MWSVQLNEPTFGSRMECQSRARLGHILKMHECTARIDLDHTYRIHFALHIIAWQI